MFVGEIDMRVTFLNHLYGRTDILIMTVYQISEKMQEPFSNIWK